MANLLNFFGYTRVVPHAEYSFYSYESYSFVTKEHEAAPYRTLDLLRDFLSYLTTDSPNTFSPAFVAVPEYSYY